MATLLGSLTALFSSSSTLAFAHDQADEPAAVVAARALIDEDLADEFADTTAPPWSTSPSLAPSAMEVAETLEIELPHRSAGFRLPLPLQAYVAGGALALFAGWLGNHPPTASMDNARGEVVTIAEDASAAAPVAAPSVEAVLAPTSTEPGIDISSLPTVGLGKLPVSALLTISVEELPNARR